MSDNDNEKGIWAFGCGCCLVMIVIFWLYIKCGVWVWKVWLIPYFVEVIQDTKDSVHGAVGVLMRVLGMQGCDWLMSAFVWILLILLIGNRIWATVQPKLVSRMVLRSIFRPMVSWGAILLIPACAIILALIIHPCLEYLNNWVNADGLDSWRRTLWQLLMGDFCLNHGIVATYFLFAPVLLRWYLAFALPGGESMVFGLNLGEELPERFKCPIRFRMLREAERILFHDVRLENECKEILLKNADCCEEFAWLGYTLYHCIVPNTREIYMLVLSGKGEKQWRKTRQSVKSILKHYKVMWTFRERGSRVGEKEFVVEHQFGGASMKFKCDSKYQFELRFTHGKLFDQAIAEARQLAGLPPRDLSDEKNGELDAKSES